LPFVVEADALEIRSAAPWTFAVAIDAGEASRVATVDESFAVEFEP